MLLKLIRDTASPSSEGEGNTALLRISDTKACGLSRTPQSGVRGGLGGTLYLNGTLFYTTLERRGVEILALWYTVNVTMSPRFKRLLPIVNSVPGRSGIRFHVGTQPKHSSGCILVPDRETETRLTQTLLQAQQRHETIYLEICDNRQPAHILQDPQDLPLPLLQRRGEQSGDKGCA